MRISGRKNEYEKGMEECEGEGEGNAFIYTFFLKNEFLNIGVGIDMDIKANSFLLSSSFLFFLPVYLHIFKTKNIWPPKETIIWS